MSERIIYYRRSRTQVRAFLEAYVALCQEHQIVLAADESGAIRPVIGGLCQHDPEWDLILGGLRGVTEERREPFDVNAWRGQG